MHAAIHHIGVVVRDIDEALGFFKDAMGLDVSERRDEPDEGVEIAVLPTSSGAIELIRPLDARGGVARFLDRRGEGVHHICLVVGDIDAAMAGLVSSGAQLLTDEAVVGTGGTRRVFIRPKSAHGVLIELLEE